MDANKQLFPARSGAFRAAVSLTVAGALLGGCSSVPDAINPVKWYDKTTDFFSGDKTASEVQPATGENQGLAADPNAPPPAAPTTVAQADGGLSADQGARDYASEPIDRQGAPTDVLRPEPEVAAAPPPPAAQPTMPVTSAPAPVPAQTYVSPAPVRAPQAMPPAAMAEAPPPVPAMPEPPQQPQQLSMADAPPPPAFNMPANAATPFGGDDFETVVISGDGMETTPTARPQLAQAPASAQPQDAAAAFPTPGATTTAGSAPVQVAGMTRVATIHFANNSSVLDARDRSILGAVIQLQRERGGRVVVVGHASSRTRDMDYIRHQMVNFEISMQRATSIGNALKDLGLAGEVLEVQAVSDAQPLYQEVMPSGEAGNRRVEIYLAAG